MKKYILLLFLFSLAGGAMAQQTSLYSQYMNNYYLLNPGVTGLQKDLLLKAGYRNQWTGFEGAPKTYYLSGHASLQQGGRRSYSLSKAYHAAGGYLFSDEAGPNNRTGVLLSYAYHLPLSSKFSNSLGITAGVQQYAFDVNKVHLADYSNHLDPVTSGGSKSSVLPDLSLGYYLYSKEFFAGVSLLQALGGKIFSYEELENIAHNKLYRHLFLSTGYSFAVNKEFTVSPSVLVKYTNAAPWQADFNVRGLYTFNDRRGASLDDQLWAGISYRTQDAIVGLFGLQFMERYSLAYSYDFTLSSIRHHSAGSHEITLGYQLKL
ncbi:PorP/SprF family type IX secretion system membrane protein [Nafulsella turpanensis]|uniref:PorP/SprF family type IX secretion system membrane protein n=1 Tax=Nafulsella turpanensis TaxID=1265690 RepID=UPI0012689BC9|nr:type IX secretion system membrane protein PorP/SprF [Nafulsella turpanensis]